jgi:putrescine aminotransferase
MTFRQGPPEAAQKHAAHINPAFIRVLGMLGYGRVFTRAAGHELWDETGARYVDFLAGFGTNCLGHSPAALIEALQAALAEQLPNVLHTGPQSAAAELGAAFAERVPSLPLAMLSLSGGEAVESALKLARAATGRHGLVYAAGGFHGTGFGNLSVMGHARWRRPFAPLLPECHAVPYGDIDALAGVFRKHKIAAFLVEPIQAEAGVAVPPDGYLLAAQTLCKKHGALFILDEVQTGLGRTGKLFAFQHTPGLDPDALVLGKALGAGLLPVSATLTRRELQEAAYGALWKFDLHGSTYAGYALGCRVALAVLRILDEKRLPERAATAGERLRDGLRKKLAGHPLVKEIRGRGLLVGISLGASEARSLLGKVVVGALSKQVFGQWLAVRLLERGFISQPASQEWNVLKLTPPLTIEDAQIDALVGAVGDILGEYRTLPPLVADVSKRFAHQVWTGGAFGVTP